MEIIKDPEDRPGVVGLVLRSDDEINYLWHALNVSAHIIKQNSDHGKGHPIFPYKRISGNMWRVLDKYLNPQDYQDGSG